MTCVDSCSCLTVDDRNTKAVSNSTLSRSSSVPPSCSREIRTSAGMNFTASRSSSKTRPEDSGTNVWDSFSGNRKKYTRDWSNKKLAEICDVV